ncbi:MAG: hypothetical protein JWP37_2965 [Mucilaginibacter sp.]|nr:hypothetical protein [Mucilaginibacter sp.]
MACSKKEMLLNGTTHAPATVSYTESTDDIVNPERGFFQYAEIRASNYVPLDKDVLISYRSSQKINGAIYSISSSLVYVEYVLDSFVTSPISSAFLSNFDQDCATARAAGVKLIPRFIYTNTTHSGSCPGLSICPPYGDATKAVILNHISQLKPYLQKNEDVIACMQLGFIGIWGENYFSDHFGDASTQGKLLDNNWQDRIDILKALLAALPADRMIQVRIPQLKERYVYGISANAISPALTEAEAFTGTDKSRIAFHNDCFLSSTNDEGTYTDYGNSGTPEKDATTALRNFEMADSKYTAVGGETCDNSYSPQNDCGPAGMAQQEFANFHYSFLNASYNVDVNDDWVTGGCMDEIKQKMGYRFVLRNATIPVSASKSGSISLSLNVDNIGYASPFNARPVQLILKNKSTGKVTAISFNTDIRRWYTGSIKLEDKLSLPAGMDAGTYDVMLSMPDAAASITNRPEYSIRLANNDLWDSTTGYNKLNAAIELK